MWFVRKLAFTIQTRYRRNRFRFFLKTLIPHQKELVLDLGGGSGSYFISVYPNKNRVILADRSLESVIEAKQQFTWLKAIVVDGCRLPFRDKSVPLIFCNSVIEHVALQEDFAEEIQRVARGYFVQTPNKLFPLDTHYLIPLFQFLPRFLQRLVYERLGGGWWRMRCRQYQDIHYLSAKMLRRLFPKSKIERERFLWLTKSFYCYNRDKENRE